LDETGASSVAAVEIRERSPQAWQRRISVSPLLDFPTISVR
jgi:hypothetical protein